MGSYDPFDYLPFWKLAVAVPNKAVKTKNTILKHSTWRALFNVQN
jgi:hypothetical protein